jgi:nucleotide-binding universal stress UspA family protein
MKPFTKILVPVDFSAHSQEATRTAADLAQRYGAGLTLLHVNEPLTYAFPDGYMLYNTEQVAAQLEQVSKALERAKELALASGAPHVDALRLDGIAHREITDHARLNGFDLIVIGTHGRRGIERLLMGSVAERVLRQANCPVLCVRAE